jgi:hypothetical protein
MSDPHPRYVTTADDLFVLDRWYCHREVYRAPYLRTAMGGLTVVTGTKAITRATCDKWNAEHDAWLAAS